jgi:uncharacterized protein YerC
MKLKSRKIGHEDRIKYLDTLYTTISSLKSKEEIKDFLKDLLTESERIMIGRRILVAQCLLKEYSYAQIISELKVGPDTIMRVHRWLDDEIKGYERAVQGLEKTMSARKNSNTLTPPSIGKKYRARHLLMNLLKSK